MQSQPSLRVVQGAMCGISTWEEHTGELVWKVLRWGGLSEVIFAQAVLHRTVITVKYSVTITVVCRFLASTIWTV